jgi:hypothetical protein
VRGWMKVRVEHETQTPQLSVWLVVKQSPSDGNRRVFCVPHPRMMSPIGNKNAGTVPVGAAVSPPDAAPGPLTARG